MPKILLWCIILMMFAHVLCQGNIKEELSKKKKGGGNGCGSYLNSIEGGFHLNFTTLNETCSFHIDVAKNTSTLILLFKTIFLHEDDVLNIYNYGNNESILSTPIKASNGSITVLLEDKNILIELTGKSTDFIRNFEGFYSTGEPHVIPLTPEVTTLYSPVYYGNSTEPIEIKYSYARVHGSDTFSTFTFKQFNLTSPNKVNFDQTTLDGDYKNSGPIEIFPHVDSEKTVFITVTMKFPTNETYELTKHDVNSKCSMYENIGDQHSYSFYSPPRISINGSDSYECHWLFFKKDGKLGVKFNTLNFESPLDIVAVTDGASELSPSLLQVTSSNLNSTKEMMIRSSGPYMWIAFKPVEFTSSVHGTISDSGDGGYFRGSGTLKVDSQSVDTSFMLEVDADNIVYLTFNESHLTSGAAIKIYDGFDETNLLTTLKNGDIWYPVMSQSTKMLVVATGFSHSNFKAQFKGISPGCHHMSTYTNENYILSKNCNTTCHWVVSPQDLPNTELLLNLQYISLEEGDSIKISQLDAARTLIGSVSSNVTFVPQIRIQSNVGVLVSTTRKPCSKEDKVVLVGHSSYIPACNNLLNVDALSKFSIVSPQYPNTYPLLSTCKWNISTQRDNIVHLAFDTYKLAPNHCIKINGAILNVSDSKLPEDFFLTGNSIVEFDTGNCVKTKMPNELQSSEGFKFNGTIADCGGVLSQKTSGVFDVPPNKTLCIWKVSVPGTSGSNKNVNIISFAYSKKDDAGNYELNVYDGSSVRDLAITNITGSDTWSRSNTLIFIYKRVDLTKPSSLLSIKYSTVGCTELCENGICLHPDWRCNGINECEDFTDEKNCASAPIPPEIKTSGYSSVTFWLTITLMFTTGVILGIAGPMCYQKYKNGQYRRFNDIQ